MIVLNKDKSRINVLLNPDDFYGKYHGNVGRIILFTALACIPFVVYILLFMTIVPFWIFALIYVPYVSYCFLRIVGRQKERVDAYLKQKSDIYASAEELIRVSDIHDDGCIEYIDNTVCYILTGYSYSYYNDDAYSKDVESLLVDILSRFDCDIYGHLVVDENNTTISELEALRVYKDREFLKERLNFYKYQDQYVRDNTTLYRLNFVVKAPKSSWNKLKKYVDSLEDSGLIEAFVDLHIASKDEVVDIMSRDITVYVDILQMLLTKHNNTDYHGSKILYFDDEVPEELKPETYNFDEEDGRRIIR